ncbi:hypothetical protein [Agrococcus sp. Marseille-Q4369]|uniref:hypothetical protein n=1 Tax=Agrococcus sp. Marseille-Q4369 TaxID=2810513 RepID=UPI001B8B778E|nr:hypothetical protein [Agrococcus sp. Marseille-Q4369]QUW18202.1 hypothetical protein JSQ78_10235 [Agrococcus sp. Marseille-Q4369]
MRIRNVIQLHTVNRMQAFGWPLLIMLASLAIVLVIGGIVVNVATAAGAESLAEAREGMNTGMMFNGAIFALLGPLIGFGFTAMGQYFPLALGLGLTRREFAIGTALVFAFNAAFYAVIVTIGKVIEVATGGYGLGVRFFDVVYTGVGEWWQTLIQTFILILGVALIGAAITSAFHRWGQPFLWIFWIALATIVVGILAGALLSEGFRGLVVDIAAMGWMPWMVVAAALSAIGGAIWFTLVRRAQAR